MSDVTLVLQSFTCTVMQGFVDHNPSSEGPTLLMKTRLTRALHVHEQTEGALLSPTALLSASRSTLQAAARQRCTAELLSSGDQLMPIQPDSKSDSIGVLVERGFMITITRSFCSSAPMIDETRTIQLHGTSTDVE